jgi:hypothetical protein
MEPYTGNKKGPKTATSFLIASSGMAFFLFLRRPNALRSDALNFKPNKMVCAACVQ